MSGTYVTPADVSISSSWQDHKNRNPPSKEPGTDFNTPYGTDIRMAESGVIVIVDNDNSGAEGRRLELIMDNGEVIDYLHCSKIMGVWNQRVTRGQTGIALSGASGNGSDHYYGPHVHVTRRTTPGLPYASSVDFMEAVGSPAGGGDTPFNPNNLTPEEIMNPILLQIDPKVDGRFVLIEYTKGTYWAVNNGWQLDRIKEDKNVRVFNGPQPSNVIFGLKQVGS
jgi:murein DD-endopeptidase MepM/ murein hydrolase activator NlpD